MQRTLLSAAVTPAATRRGSAAALFCGPAVLCSARRWRSTRDPASSGSSSSSSSAPFLSHPSSAPTSSYTDRLGPRSPRPHARGGSGFGGGGGGRGPVKDRIPPVPTDLADPRRRLAVLVDGSNPHLLPSGASGTSATITADQILRTSALFTTVLPAVLQVGVPVLLRVFAHQLPAAWETLLAGNASRAGDARSAASPAEAAAAAEEAPCGAAHPFTVLPLPSLSEEASSSSTGVEADVLQPRLQLEYFRVERFIPIAMQIEADARHLYELRTLNKVEGVCYVCHEVDRAMYVSLMQEQRSGSAGLAHLLYPNSQHGGTREEEGSSPQGAAAFFNQYVLDEMGMAEELLSDPRSKDGS